MSEQNKVQEEAKDIAKKAADRILLGIDGVDPESYRKTLELELEIVFFEGRLSKGRSEERRNLHI